MPSKTKNLLGQKFGKWEVIAKAPHYLATSGQYMTRWLCRCECNRRKEVFANNLLNGTSTGCKSCNSHFSLNTIATPLDTIPGYTSWQNMKQRCYNPKHHKYHLYGARGITVCARWLNDFKIFISDMGPKPGKKHSIERRNGNGNYEPDNCYWATPKQQRRNLRPIQHLPGWR